MSWERELVKLGYEVERLDPCQLWETGDVDKYTITNYIKQVGERVAVYAEQEVEDIVLIGHSLGAFVAIIAGSRIDAVSRVVALCSVPNMKGTVLNWKGNNYRHSERELPSDPRKVRKFSVPYAFAEDGLQYSVAEEVEKLHKPLMIFVGLEDKVVLPEDSEKVVANANNPYVVRLPGMGHDFRYSQGETEIVWSEIEKFIEHS